MTLKKMYKKFNTVKKKKKRVRKKIALRVRKIAGKIVEEFNAKQRGSIGAFKVRVFAGGVNLVINEQSILPVDPVEARLRSKFDLENDLRDNFLAALNLSEDHAVAVFVNV